MFLVPLCPDYLKPFSAQKSVQQKAFESRAVRGAVRGFRLWTDLLDN